MSQPAILAKGFNFFLKFAVLYTTGSNYNGLSVSQETSFRKYKLKTFSKFLKNIKNYCILHFEKHERTFFSSLLSWSTPNQTPDSIITLVKCLQKVYLKGF